MKRRAFLKVCGITGFGAAMPFPVFSKINLVTGSAPSIYDANENTALLRVVTTIGELYFKLKIEMVRVNGVLVMRPDSQFQRIMFTPVNSLIIKSMAIENPKQVRELTGRRWSPLDITKDLYVPAGPKLLRRIQHLEKQSGKKEN